MKTYVTSRPKFHLGQILPKKQRKFSAFPLDQKGSYYFFSARYALAAAIEALGLTRGDKILVPSYNCGAEVDPILHLNVKPVFYRIKKDLSVDMDDLQKKINDGVRAILITHFLGFPQPIDEVKRICIEKDLFLIEDCAHAFLSTENGNYLGSYGDAAIFSLLKTLPIPNGGILTLNNDGLSHTKPSSKPGFLPTLLYAGELLKPKADGSNNCLGEKIERFLCMGVFLCVKSLRFLLVRYRKLFDGKGLFLARPDSRFFVKELCSWGISDLTRNIINEIDFEKIKTIRRKNFEYLLNYFLKKNPEILLLRELPPGVCPLFLPIILESTEKRKGLWETLKNRGIIMFGWWQFHPEVPWDEFPDAVFLKTRLLGLPVHQDLSLVHLDWIIDFFEKAYREQKKLI